MNILFVCHIWPPAIDGGSQIIANLQLNLKNKHSTLVLTTACRSTDDFIKPKSKPIHQKTPDIFRLPVFKTKLFLYLKKLFRSNFFKLLATGPIFKPIPLLMAVKKIINFKPDLIIAGPLPTTISVYALILRKLTKGKLLILPCVHQNDLSFQNPILLNTIKQSDYIWALTKHEKNYLKNNQKINKPKIFYIYPAISNIFFNSIKKINNKHNTNLLFLGNLAAHKNINLLLSAFAKINSTYPQTRLSIIGQKTLYYPQIRKKYQSIPVSIRKNIKIIVKKYTPAQAKFYLNQADILINPSSHESFGLVFLEAMSQGIPVIGSDIPPVAEIINSSKAGLTFKDKNLSSLIFVIKKLLNNNKLSNILSLNGLKFSHAYSWSNISKTLLNEI